MVSYRRRKPVTRVRSSPPRYTWRVLIGKIPALEVGKCQFDSDRRDRYCGSHPGLETGLVGNSRGVAVSSRGVPQWSQGRSLKPLFKSSTLFAPFQSGHELSRRRLSYLPYFLRNFSIFRQTRREYFNDARARLNISSRDNTSIPSDT